MTRYIWITAIVLVFILILAFKQVGQEPPAPKPASENISETATSAANP